jgi:hypothetical protein
VVATPSLQRVVPTPSVIETGTSAAHHSKKTDREKSEKFVFLGSGACTFHRIPFRAARRNAFGVPVVSTLVWAYLFNRFFIHCLNFNQ